MSRVYRLIIFERRYWGDRSVYVHRMRTRKFEVIIVDTPETF
jgi:hypothetical protein